MNNLEKKGEGELRDRLYSHCHAIIDKAENRLSGITYAESKKVHELCRAISYLKPGASNEVIRRTKIILAKDPPDLGAA